MQTHNNSIRGGNTLASGGFGCIFKPALKCKDSILEPEPGEVSKLMTKKHANAEYSQIQTFKKVLERIPNYEKYFLVTGFSLCQPSKLSDSDKNNFTKCSALTKKGYTKDNINDPETLDKLLIINMPDGGIDVKTYVSEIENINILNAFNELNNALVDLLINGVGPMNALDLYHGDIKGGNILVSSKFTYKKSIEMNDEERNNKSNSINCILIDWGLSVHHRVKTGIPRRLYRRPFQYNVPWSNILFNHVFSKRYNAFLLQCKDLELDLYLVKEFVMDYIFLWNKERGVGHLKSINSFFKLLTYSKLPNIQSANIKKHVIEYEFTYNYIVDYISQILMHFTKNGEFQLLEYFNTVFIKNIDIWGLVMTYSVFIKKLIPSPSHMTRLTAEQKHLVNKIKRIMFHYLFEAPVKVIDINKVAQELQSLNTIYDNIINTNNDLKTFSELKGGSKSNKSNKNARKGRRRITCKRNCKKTYKKR
jgi:hypothetical protein